MYHLNDRIKQNRLGWTDNVQHISWTDNVLHTIKTTDVSQLMFNSFPGETATSEGREKCGQINECAMDCKNATDFTVPSPKA